MKESRFQSLYNGLNSVAKKVYQVVPISEHWSTHKIKREIDRIGLNMDIRVIQGSLGHMLDIGIISCNRTGDFIRTTIRTTVNNPLVEQDDHEEEDIPMNIPKEVQAAVKPQIPQALFPVSLDEELHQLSIRALSISESLTNLSIDIEKAAKRAKQTNEANEKELAALHQLKQIFQSLGGKP